MKTVIANDIAGFIEKGVSFLEDRKKAWLWQLSDDECTGVVKEIRGDLDTEDQQLLVRASGALE